MPPFTKIKGVWRMIIRIKIMMHSLASRHSVSRRDREGLVKSEYSVLSYGRAG